MPALLLLGAHIAAVCVLYGRALAAGFCCDDGQILFHAASHAPWRYFADPEAWRALVPSSLTPWLSLSYRVDLALVGTATTGYYVHQLLAVAGCGLMLHLLLREWVGRGAALAGVLVFLAGVPVAQATRLLMVRHYVEGLAALLLCLWLVARQSRQPTAWRAAASAAAFAVAASAKEVVLPLGALALAVAAGDLRARLRAAWPVLLVMALYVPWRAVMLGDLVGGYVPSGAPDALPAPARAWAALGGVPALLWRWPSLALAALVVLAALAWRAASGRMRVAAVALHAAVLVLLLVPLVPLVEQAGIAKGSERYLYAGWVALAFGCAVWLHAAWPKAGAAAKVALLAALLALVGSAWPLSRQALRSVALIQAEDHAHFEFITRGRSDEAMIASATTSAWFIEGAIGLRAAETGAGPAPAVIVDEFQLPDPQPLPRPLWQWSARDLRRVDVSASLPERLSAWSARVHPLPMEVALAWDGPELVLRWRITGAGSPRFTLVAADQAFPVPEKRTALRFAKPLPRCFRLRADTADGRIAYTPWLRLDMPPGARTRVDWQGVGETAAAVRAARRCPDG